MKRKKTAERKQQIIDEAIGIIHNGGLSMLTIRNLALKVDISEGAIYRHFKGKDDIFEGIFNKIDSVMNGLPKELNKEDNMMTQLKRFIFFHMNMFENMPEFSSLMFSSELFENNELLADSVSKLMKQRHEALIKILKDGIVNGEFIDFDAEIMAMMIQGYLKLLITKWKRSGFNFSLIHSGNKFNRTLEKLLLKIF